MLLPTDERPSLDDNAQTSQEVRWLVESVHVACTCGPKWPSKDQILSCGHDSWSLCSLGWERTSVMTIHAVIVPLVVILSAALAADVFTVVNPITGVDSGTCGSETQPCKTISGALTLLPSVIHLVEGNYTGAGNLNLNFSYPLRVLGLGKVVVQGSFDTGGPWTLSSEITLSGISFLSMATSNSSALIVMNSYVSFINCSFLGNTINIGMHLCSFIDIRHPVGSGGAIYLLGGSASFSNCSFLNNAAGMESRLLTLIAFRRRVRRCYLCP